MSASCRHLVVVLGDQLDRDASAFDGFDPAQDRVWMCEASDESTHVWSSQQRIVQFLAAMRHFAQALQAEGLPLHYDTLREGGLGDALREAIAQCRPARVRLTQPGDWRVLQSLSEAAGNTPLDVLEDRHFLCSTARFARHARGRRQLRMEYFYREMRREHGVLMEGDQPAGGEWNFDADNREAFGPNGPGFVPPPTRFEPDGLTQQVMDLVRTRFADHPGQTAPFGWPVTRAQALQALQGFIDERLPNFGHWQDAMWTGEPWLYHAHLAAAMNLKLLHPREVIAAAEAAWREGRAPLPAVEGFIRQILGWREYVRGIYWLQMPDYAEQNALDARHDLPACYWTGHTPMRCMADAIGQTLQHGYAHHIQRLMVTGLFALLYGVEPRQVHGWYLSVYVDAVEWVELPNTLGMSQYADGGLLASKPYIATGRYIERMSDHCRGCRFDPGQRTGERACPFTTLYWDFLIRHEARFAKHPRLALQVKNLARIEPAERSAIVARANEVRTGQLG
ncbi:MAG: cryptochrome/photolyase family protein [Hydrogenophaga sp.]|jgi:deoxyribodipyrimidine photolyase-related protein|uniref:cryptochrome/photolyase family protein n=1 Tax=Hydrogenophaga sp. TaxID=1904254 RepID=UPI001DB1DCE3|nr:cryptochrome/photolyase family protein [Hydrogenophaga sp.]MBW0170412.1 cryptochrome/photolyase family protein [Hydrogenophaga sp.]MBW0185100.1 cryptochrome/photolyase family protein [Hydrogenophaga sp.]